VSSPSPPTVPEARNDPVLRRFALRRLRLPLGPSTLSMVIPDASDWIRRGEWAPATMAGAEPPYWVQVWPASVAAARVLVRLEQLASMRVLDLGCGLGVPGAAAASRGAEVVFADMDPDALGFARWNATRLAGAERVRIQRVDWTRDFVAGVFDVVVLADVTYRPVHHVSMRTQLRQCLPPESLVLHTDPHRPEATPFVEWLHREFHCREVSRMTAFGQRRDQVRICAASRSERALAAWSRALGEGDAPAPRLP
jgi:SAM-dependent methyltransferase